MRRPATTTDHKLAEYLRRNTLHCASVGSAAAFEAALVRLRAMKKSKKWLLAILEGGLDRARRVSIEMANHRDELDPKR